MRDGDALWAVLVSAAASARLVPLGSAAAVERELQALRFALRRLARGAGSDASQAVSRDSAAQCAGALDACLLAPLAGHVDVAASLCSSRRASCTPCRGRRSHPAADVR